MRIRTVLLLYAAAAAAFELPSSLDTIYNALRRSDTKCRKYVGNNNRLSDGHGNAGWGFCRDLPGAVYLRGPAGRLGDMDVDCDGASNCEGWSEDYQSATAFDGTLTDGYGIRSLNASVHAFAVLGTCHVDVEVPPLALVAVVCGGALHYGVFGDTNGCDDDNFTGEASLALARLCFPDEGLHGMNGHDNHDVLYLAFTTDDAVVGPNDAAWDAPDADTFQQSLRAKGDRLLEKFVATTEKAGASGRAATAGWALGVVPMATLLATLGWL